MAFQVKDFYRHMPSNNYFTRYQSRVYLSNIIFDLVSKVSLGFLAC